MLNSTILILDILLHFTFNYSTVFLHRHRALGNDFESRRHTWCRLKADPNQQIIGNSKPRTEHQNLRCPGAACQLSARHGANCRVLRSVSISNIIEVQKLHRLSIVCSGDEPVLVHDQVTRRVEGQNDGLGAGGAVEADYGAVSVVILGVGSV